MGRKIAMRRIENTTRCQVTFSKRKSSLLRKGYQIFVRCDIDIVIIVFSPSGRFSHFCSRNRIEEVIERYINLPPEERYLVFNKIYFGVCVTTKQHLELRIKEVETQMELLDNDLKNYEPCLEHEEDASLAQILLCEKNLKCSLRRIISRKKILLANWPNAFESLPIQVQVTGYGEAELMDVTECSKVRESLLRNVHFQDDENYVSINPYVNAMRICNANPPLYSVGNPSSILFDTFDHSISSMPTSSILCNNDLDLNNYRRPEKFARVEMRSGRNQDGSLADHDLAWDENLNLDEIMFYNSKNII
ncbi:hypothetical protein K2173_005206 [Erythroxylum novogranatense]|uniref:MADS-box domain-containing protein n=1 Tax=Erythroxylum novogranatense TaxID=1862640 RepID=A0AAV8TS62_9ROSI|nr:hypothetical protein K2173_005206 [Erythroxylum novogranatense]